MKQNILTADEIQNKLIGLEYNWEYSSKEHKEKNNIILQNACREQFIPLSSLQELKVKIKKEFSNHRKSKYCDYVNDGDGCQECVWIRIKFDLLNEIMEMKK